MLDYRQTQAGALGAGGEKGCEYLLLNGIGQSRTLVTNRETPSRCSSLLARFG